MIIPQPTPSLIAHASQRVYTRPLDTYRPLDPSDTPLSHTLRPIVGRRDGQRVYARHKCVRCGAHPDQSFIFHRQLEDYPEIGSRALDAIPGDHWLFEQCLDCGRVTGWPFYGFAPRGWTPPPPPAYHVKRDALRSRAYLWERRWRTPYLQEPLSDVTVDELTLSLTHNYQMPDPAITHSCSRTAPSWARGYTRVHYSSSPALPRAIVFHEVAHLLHRRAQHLDLAPPDDPGHSGLWAAIYLQLSREHDPSLVISEAVQASKDLRYPVVSLREARRILTELAPQSQLRPRY